MIEENGKLGKYRLIRQLGQGGEGVVYLAEDESLGRQAAVKRLWERGRTGEEIKREAAFLRDLRHPMLPVVYELFYLEGWYLAMEYIQGISLHNYIRERGRVEEKQALLWAASLLGILDYLHTRETPVIYRDFKPDNIMVCRDGSLRLVDFGGAAHKSYGEERDVEMAASLGFCAPEQWGAGGQGVCADERSDLYAFGKTLYYMVTGADPAKPPYGALSPSLYNPLLSPGMERVILRCTRENPKERYQVAAEAFRDLADRRGRLRGGRSGFLRHVEKQVYLTEKEGIGLL